MIKIATKLEDKGIIDKTKKIIDEYSNDSDSEIKTIALWAQMVGNWKLIIEQLGIISLV